jgi:phage-related protein
MALPDKPLVWLHGAVKSPPFSPSARLEAGVSLRRVQRGEKLGMPHARSMPSVGSRCHELRILDAQATWRILYRIDVDAIVIVEVFSKKTQTTPQHVIQVCRQRLRKYDKAAEEEE